jgi:predicted flap endonuclease-1-like 5' DNA nuclease
MILKILAKSSYHFRQHTFSQISKLTHTDIETITEELEIIPVCLERDNWVGKARELAKKQEQKEMN